MTFRKDLSAAINRHCTSKNDIVTSKLCCVVNWLSDFISSMSTMSDKNELNYVDNQQTMITDKSNEGTDGRHLDFSIEQLLLFCGTILIDVLIPSTFCSESSVGRIF